MFRFLFSQSTIHTQQSVYFHTYAFASFLRVSQSAQAWTKFTKYSPKPRHSSVEYWVFPLCFEDHWILFIYSVAQSWLFNSLQETNKKYLQYAENFCQ